MEKFETHTISPVYPVYDRLAQYFHVPVSAEFEFEFEFEYKIEKRERTSYHQPPVSIWLYGGAHDLLDQRNTDKSGLRVGKDAKLVDVTTRKAANTNTFLLKLKAKSYPQEIVVSILRNRNYWRANVEKRKNRGEFVVETYINLK